MNSYIKKGFTLVELLAVVLILGILMAIALPSFLSSTQQSKMATGGANAKAISSAVQGDFVRTGGGSYAGYSNGAITGDAEILADLGGSVPDNPCSASNGISGYQITATDTSWSIAPKKDACPNVSKRPTFKLGIDAP